MVRKAYIPLLIFAILLVSLPAQAQNNRHGSSGSTYSKIGLGAPVDPANSTAYSMGLIGVSFIEPQVPSLGNPAQWGFTEYGIASGGFDVRTTNAIDQTGRSSNTLLSTTNFQLQLPLWQRTWGASLSFYPSTRSSYHIMRDGQQIVGSGQAADTLDYTSESSGSGGINNIELGLGWSPTDNLAVGYAAKLVFASIDSRYLTTFGSEGYRPVDYTLQTSGSTIGHRFGTYLRFPDLLASGDQLSMGVSVDLPVTIQADRDAEDSELRDGTLDRSSPGIGEGEISLPMTLTGGLTYRVNALTAFTVEGLFQNWDGAAFSYNSGDEAMFSNRIKVGAGLRYHPFATGSTKFFSLFKYRLGASYDTGHLTINDTDISTLRFSGGIGISSTRSGSTIDLSFYYGLRGSQSQNLVKEDIWGLRLSLNLAELMFTRQRLE